MIQLMYLSDPSTSVKMHSGRLLMNIDLEIGCDSERPLDSLVRMVFLHKLHEGLLPSSVCLGLGNKKVLFVFLDVPFPLVDACHFGNNIDTPVMRIIPSFI